jgi:hypothetical protein
LLHSRWHQASDAAGCLAHLVAPNSQRNQFDSDELAEEPMKRYLDISQSWKTDE